MIEIVIAVGDNSKRFSRILYEHLSETYKVALYGNSLYKRKSTDMDIDIVIIESLPPKEFYSPCGVLVFTGTEGIYTSETILKTEGNIVAIVSSSDKQTQELLAQNKIKTITCGLSSRDTVTASSIEHDSAVISLQRNLTAFSGKTAEPIEIPVKLCTGYSINDMMIITAIKLLI